jgi:hypothetical protein
MLIVYKYDMSRHLPVGHTLAERALTVYSSAASCGDCITVSAFTRSELPRRMAQTA